MHAHDQVGVQLVASEPPWAPGYNSNKGYELQQKMQNNQHDTNNKP